MSKWYSVKSLAKSGLLPYKSDQSIIDLIESGRLKAIVTGEKEGKRYHISQEEVDKFLSQKS